MSVLRPYRKGEIWMGRLPHGSDLLEELTRICVERDVRIGRVEALGAVRRARIACYNQEALEYEYLDLDHPLEIAKLIGNVSLLDGRPFVHAHVTLSDEAGRAWGGHLSPGTEVFACEFLIESFEGEPFERRPEPETGLPLWGDREGT